MAHYILGINGSPHIKSTVAMLLARVLSGARSAGAETETIHLSELCIRFSPGLYSVDPDLETVTNMPEDDMMPIYEKIIRASGIVFATPNYWGLLSGMMKNFIDRLTPLENEYKLNGKIAAFVAASKENQGGTEFAAMSMLIPIIQMGFMVPPFSVLWYPSSVKQAGNKTEEDWAITDAPLVGRNMVRLAERTKDIRWFSD